MKTKAPGVVQKEKKYPVRVSIKGYYNDPNHHFVAKFYVTTCTASEVVYLIANRPHKS